MTQIDTLLQKLSQMDADRATLRADENVEVIAAGLRREGAHVDEELLRTFLLEVIPDDHKAELHGRIPISFNYSTSHGEYAFSITGYPGKLQAEIEPIRPKAENSRAIPLEVAQEIAAKSESAQRKIKWMQVLLVVAMLVVLGIGGAIVMLR